VAGLAIFSLEATAAAESDPQANLLLIAREAASLRDVAREIRGRPTVESNNRLAHLTARSAQGIEHALEIGRTPLAVAYKDLLIRHFHDAPWRLAEQAKAGSSSAEYALAVLQLHGILTAQDTQAACEGFSRALERKFTGARFRLSECLRESDPVRSRELLEQAADTGHLAANERAARACLSAQPRDAICALNRLHMAAAGGRPPSQALLGWMYAQGIGGPPNLPRAARLYELAAKAGDPSAQTNLGELYETGQGVKPDPKQALAFYRLAAESNHPIGQFNYGRALAAGIGGAPDFQGARVWLARAEAAGIVQARTLIGWLDGNRTKAE